MNTTSPASNTTTVHGQTSSQVLPPSFSSSKTTVGIIGVSVVGGIAGLAIFCALMCVVYSTRRKRYKYRLGSRSWERKRPGVSTRPSTASSYELHGEGLPTEIDSKNFVEAPNGSPMAKRPPLDMSSSIDEAHFRYECWPVVPNNDPELQTNSSPSVVLPRSAQSFKWSFSPSINPNMTNSSTLSPVGGTTI
ncbi:hypothetical protein MMC28_003210 [Mycoblastus sanguinarius]|nr:hypothetical protein [Mycoblastus sanguinarius]